MLVYVVFGVVGKDMVFTEKTFQREIKLYESSINNNYNYYK